MKVSFVVYDPSTGNLLKGVNLSAPAQDAPVMIAANTPAGMSNLILPDGSEAPVPLSAWVVSGDKLVPRS